MMEDELSSGFVGTNRPDEGALRGMKEIYCSASGYNRLFCCERYGRLHVLKVLKDAYVGSQFYEQALYKEFSIGYQLEHPHICRTLGWEELPALGHGVLLEYIDGVTLKELMEQRRITAEQAYKWIAELCGALQYLHSKQIVHRDLKPSNVLITHNGSNCKLIDFSLSDCDDYDVLKLPAGTRYYLAPEALNPNEALDLRADVYSLGVIIGELATMLNDKHLAAISRKCTQRRKEKRYDSAAKVLEALQRPSHKRLFAVAGVVTLVTLMLGVAYWGMLRETPPAMSVSSFPVYGNLSVNEDCRRILSAERRRLSEHPASPDLEADSLLLLQRLKAALDADYPLAVQRETESYRKHWEAVKKEAHALISLRRRQ